MRKIITVHSRGEAQRLLVSGEVKELVDSRGYGRIYDKDFGIISNVNGSACPLEHSPWTYEIEVPNEAPKWRIWSVKAADFPAYEYSAASYCLRRGVEVHQQSLKTDRAYTAEEVINIAQAEADARNALPIETREQLIELLAPAYEECSFDDAGDGCGADGLRSGLIYSPGWVFGYWHNSTVNTVIWLRKKKPTRRQWGPWEEVFKGEEPAKNGREEDARIREFVDGGWDLIYTNGTHVSGGSAYDIPVRLAAQPVSIPVA
jgi:hypothetical protein